MVEIATTRELIVRLLKIGGAPDIDELFGLLVAEAPRLVGAKECSIFWKDGAWRNKWRKGQEEPPDAFYRRATYEAKRHLIGIDYYRPGEGLTGWVGKHGLPLRIDDITDRKQLARIASDLQWADKGRGFKDSPDPNRQRAFLAVPVKIEGEVVGIIRIAKTLEVSGTFDRGAEELLHTFAEHVAEVIRRVEDARLRDLWESLYLSGISLRREDFSEYLQRVADEVPGFLGANACSIFLVKSEAGAVVLNLAATTSGGPLAHKVGVARYNFGEGLTGWVAKHNRSLRLRDVGDSAELGQYGDDLKHKGKHEEYVGQGSSFLASPISIGDQVFGVIRIAQDSAGKFFPSSDQRHLEYFCKNLAVLVQNVSLFEQTESEKEDAIERLRRNELEFRELGRLLRQDIGGIEKSLKELLPDKEDSGTTKIGPVIVETRERDMHKVFVGIPFTAQYRNVYDFAISPALKRAGLLPWVAFEERSAIDIMRKVFDGIQRCHVGIVDISEWNPNVLFELGVLYGLNHPVILLKREDAQVPADLAGLEYIQYGEFAKLEEKLVQHLRALLPPDLLQAAQR